MEKIRSSSNLDVAIDIRLNEKEAKALLALTVYGTPEFLNTFYKNLGEHDLKPNEAGLKSLFETVKSELPKHLSRAEDARRAWDGEPLDR